MKSDKSKKNVFLDLDNTIISSIPADEFKWKDKETKKKMKKFKYHELKDGDDLVYLVFERPKLKEFLDYLFENFNVFVWTAATGDYAAFILKNVISRPVGIMLFSYHCKWSKTKHKGTPKKLEMLWTDFGLDEFFNPENTVIIDDLDRVKKAQPDLCIDIHPFEFEDLDSEKDDVLMSEIKPRLEKKIKIFD